MKVFIVDDSRLARQELKSLLQARSDVDVVGEADDADRAILDIDALRPDVLLLDIHMPGKSGFDVLDSLQHMPAVIFVTAYDEHAVRAFEVNALDYLLKPVVPERLYHALDKVAGTRSRNSKPRAGHERIFIRDGERCWLVRVADMKLLEVAGNYTCVHFENDRAILPRSLRQLQERLDPKLFFRANRAQLVNVEWIRSLSPDVGEGLIATLRDGTQIAVSRRQAKELQDRMEI